jgi:dTDP-4-dehydrorhamnose 3,5-epimerase-like enzyme
VTNCASFCLCSTEVLVEMKVTIERIEVHRDARGSVFEPVDAEALAAQRNVHVVFTEPGAIRGNHYHRCGIEVVAFSGPMLVRLRDGDEPMDFEVAGGEVVKLTIPPGVAHAFKNTGQTLTTMVAFNTETHNPKVPDIVREILIEA